MARSVQGRQKSRRRLRAGLKSNTQLTQKLPPRVERFLLTLAEAQITAPKTTQPIHEAART